MKLRTLHLFCLLVFTVLFVGCGSGTTEESTGDYVEKDGKVYYRGQKNNDVVVHISSEPPSLHPTNARTSARTFILELVFQRLLAMDITTGNLMPELAAALPERSADGLTYTYELNPQAAWPDGKAITAEDVLFSVKVMAAPLVDNLNQKSYIEFLKDIRIDSTNNRRFWVEMKEYYMHNDNFGIYSFILDARMYDPENKLGKYTLTQLLTDAENIAKDPEIIAWAETFNSPRFGTDVTTFQSGSGPYKMSEWATEQQIILTRNENYWGKGRAEHNHSQTPDRIIYKIIRDDNSLELQIKQQEVDVSTQLTSQVYENLKASEVANEHYHIGITPRDSYAFILLNNRPDGIGSKKYFDDKRTRQALAYALPIADMIADIYPNTAKQTISPVPIVNKDYNDKIKPFPFNPEKARQLLEEVGWKDSDGNNIRDKMIGGEKVEFSFTLMYPPSDQAFDDFIQRIKNALAEVGINCITEQKTMGAAVPMIRAQNFDALVMALSSPSLAYDFKQMFYSGNWPEGDNFFGFNNPEADDLIEQARTEQDPAKRKQIVDRIQEIIYEEQPCTFLFNPTQKIAIHKRFNHATMYPTGDHVILNQLEMIREN
ncbi:MAG: ABC transporter substrate-binding protein [Bacteroidia bacterium]|nr:ABC transporter substrate-binding protein [Bacteroidia bacterium]